MRYDHGSSEFRVALRFLVIGVVMLAIAVVGAQYVMPLISSADAPSDLRWFALIVPIVLVVLAITGCGSLIAAGVKFLSGLGASERM